LEECRDAPKAAKDIAEKYMKGRVEEERPPPEPAMESTVPRKQAKISDVVPATPPDLRAEIDRAVFDFFVANRIPFWTADDYYWHRVVGHLRSTYTSPCGATMRYSMLERRAVEANEHIVEDLKSAVYASVLADGWTNVRRDHVVNIAVCFRGKTFLWVSNFLGSETCDAKRIASMVLESIEEIEANSPVKVIALITDNARSMEDPPSLSNRKNEKRNSVHRLHGARNESFPL